MGRLRRFRKLGIGDRWLLIEATLCIAVARLGLALLPFRRIAPWLGEHKAVTSEAQDSRDTQTVMRIQSAIRRASRHVPWEARCLVQAIAGAVMLRSRRIEGTVYLGIAREGEADVMAHAWLRSGVTIVTGGRRPDQLSVISTFAFPAKHQP